MQDDKKLSSLSKRLVTYLFRFRFWFFLHTPLLFSLPTQPEVVHGRAVVSAKDAQSLQITTSETAILNFESFHIGADEIVRFRQPGPHSCVLNRVLGKDPTEILGRMEANGRVFLVNPEGVYFGPQASIHAGSFIASSLSIKDEDFIAGTYRFFKEGSGSVINEGSIGVEGFVALLGSVVQNKGSIRADTDKVWIGAAERVTLDFSGDGMIQFALEGELEKAVIEHSGSITARGVELSLKAAKRAIQTVVNTDGMEQATHMVESNGVIRLLSGSSIDVSSETGMGGQVEISGLRVDFEEASIDASGRTGGGSISIRGDSALLVDRQSVIRSDAKERGKGGKISVYSDHIARFNGHVFAQSGSGEMGEWVIESKDLSLGTTVSLEGISHARFSALESLRVDQPLQISSEGLLTLQAETIQINANVSTIDSISLIGKVSLGADVVLEAKQGDISVSDELNGSHNLLLRGDTIYLCKPIGELDRLHQFSIEARSVLQTASVYTTGPITYSGSNIIHLGSGLTTDGAPIEMRGPINCSNAIVFDTTHGGGNLEGANLFFSDRIDGPQEVRIRAGTKGNVTLNGPLGEISCLGSLLIDCNLLEQKAEVSSTGPIRYQVASQVDLLADMVTQGGEISLSGPVFLHNQATIDTTSRGACILGADLTIVGKLESDTSICLNAGQNGVLRFVGDVGSQAPVQNILFRGSRIIQEGVVQATGAICYSGAMIELSGLTRTQGGGIECAGALCLKDEVILDATSLGKVILAGPVDGCYPLTLIGSAEWHAPIGETTPLASLFVEGPSISQKASVRTSGGLDYKGAISLTDSIQTQAGAISLNGEVVLNGSTLLEAGQEEIFFSRSIRGEEYDLTLLTGVGGCVSFSDAVAVRSLFVQGAELYAPSSMQATGSIDLNGSAIYLKGVIQAPSSRVKVSGPVFLTAPLKVMGEAIRFESTVDGSYDLDLQGHSLVELGTGLGWKEPLQSIHVQAPQIIQNGAIQTIGPLSYEGKIYLSEMIGTEGSFVQLKGDVEWERDLRIDTTSCGKVAQGAPILFSGEISGRGDLTLEAGLEGEVTLQGPVQGVHALTITAKSIKQNGEVQTTGPIDYAGALSIDQDLKTDAGSIVIQGPITLNNHVTVHVSEEEAIRVLGSVNGLYDVVMEGGRIDLLQGVGGQLAVGSLHLSAASALQTGLIRSKGEVSLNGPIFLNGSITTDGSSIALNGDVICKGSKEICLSSAGGDISIQGTVNGDFLGRSLCIAAGNGDVSFQGTIDETVPLSNLTVSGSTISFSDRGTGSIVSEGNTLIQAAKEIHFNGSIVSAGAQTYEAQSHIWFNAEAPTTVSSAGLPLIFSAARIDLKEGTDLAVQSYGGRIALPEIHGPLQRIVVDAQRGQVILGDMGRSGAIQSLLVNASSITQGSIDSKVPPIFQSETVLTLIHDQIGPLTYNCPVVIGAKNLVFSKGPIIFNSTLDADGSTEERHLKIEPGIEGRVVFNGLVGKRAPLTSLTIGPADSVVANGEMHVGSFAQAEGTNKIVFRKGITASGSGGIQIAAKEILLAGKVATTQGGLVLLDNQNTLTVSPCYFSLTGPLQQIGTGGVVAGGWIEAAEQSIHFASPIELVSSLHIRAGSIQFSQSVSGLHPLGLHGTTVEMEGAIFVESLDVTATQISQKGPVKVRDAIRYTGSIEVGGDQTAIQGSIHWNGPALLTGDVSVSAPQIRATSTIDGNYALSWIGTSSLMGSVGSHVPLRTLQVKGLSIHQNGAVQTIGSIFYEGTIHLRGDLTASEGAIRWNGPVWLNQPVFVTGSAISAQSHIEGLHRLCVKGETVELAGNVGTKGLEIDAAIISQFGQVNSLQSIRYAATTAIELGGNLRSKQGSITLDGTVCLRNDLSIEGEHITFLGALDGQMDCTVLARGNIAFSAPVGSVEPLASLNIAKALDVQAQTIQAGSFTQWIGTGVTTLEGPLFLSGSKGFHFFGNQLQISHPLQAPEGGATIAAKEILVVGPQGAFSLKGPFSQIGLATTQLAGSIQTNNQPIRFSGPVHLMGSATLSTGSKGADIHFLNRVEGPGHVQIDAGKGNLFFCNGGGQSIRLGDVCVEKVADFTAKNLTVQSLVQKEGSGTTFLNGEINAAGTIDLVVNHLIQNGSVITHSGGSYLVQSSGSVYLNGSSTIDCLFSIQGAASVWVEGDIRAHHGSICFGGEIHLTDRLTLYTGSGDIEFAGLVGGKSILNLSAIKGDILFAKSVEGLEGIVIQAAENVSMQAVEVSFFSQKAGCKTTTLNGPLTTHSPFGMEFIGNHLNVFANATTENGGPISILNGGRLTFSPKTIIRSAGPFKQIGPGSNQLAGYILANGKISFAQNIDLSGHLTLKTSATNQDIALFGAIDGDKSLKLIAGSGHINLHAPIGQTTRIGKFLVESVGDLTAAPIYANAIIQQKGSGISTFNGLDAGQIELIGTQIRCRGNVSSGSLIFTNKSLLTVSMKAMLEGSLLQNGTGPVLWSGSCQTKESIECFSSISLGGDATWKGEGIVFRGALDGAFEAHLDAGSGDITLSDVGQSIPLSTLVLERGRDISVDRVCAGSILQSSGTGVSTFYGSIRTIQSGGISLRGNELIFLSPVVTEKWGPVDLFVDSKLTLCAPFSVDGSFTQRGDGEVFLSSTITTHDHDLSLTCPISLLGSICLDSGTSVGDVVLLGTIQGEGSCTLSSGLGRVVAKGAIGPIDDLTIQGESLVLSSLIDVKGGVALQASSSIELIGLAYKYDHQTYAAPQIFIHSGACTTFETAHTPVVFSATQVVISEGTDLHIRTRDGPISLAPLVFNSVSPFGQTVILDAGKGDVTVHSMGSLSSVSLTGKAISLNGSIVSDRVDLFPAEVIYLGGSITTSHTPLLFSAPVIQQVPGVTLSTSGSSICFEKGWVGDGKCLRLEAGTGSICFKADVGMDHPFDTIDIASASDVSVAFMRGKQFSQCAGTNTTTFNGKLQVDEITLDGHGFTFLEEVHATNITLLNSGPVRFEKESTLTLKGELIQSGSGLIYLSNQIKTGGDISFSAPVSIQAPVQISTAENNRSITFSQPLNGPGDLCLTAGKGNITFQSPIGQEVRLGSFVVRSSHDLSHYGLHASSAQLHSSHCHTSKGAIDLNGPDGLTLVTKDACHHGQITVSAGSVNLTISGVVEDCASGPTLAQGDITCFSSHGFSLGHEFISRSGNILIQTPLSLSVPCIYDTSQGGGEICFSGEIEGPASLTLIAGSGNIILSRPVGSRFPLGSFTIESAKDVNAQPIYAGSFQQKTGTGSTILNGALKTTTGLGISICTHNLILAGSIQTQRSGGLSIHAQGQLQGALPLDISLSGPFVQTGPGQVRIAGKIATEGSSISFESPIDLNGDLTLHAGSRTGSISIAETVQGSFSLQLSAQGGPITLAAPLGSLEIPLASLIILDGAEIKTESICAERIEQISGAATTSFGSLYAKGADSISLSGTVFRFEGEIRTEGAMTVYSKEVATYLKNLEIGGTFLQIGNSQLASGMNIDGDAIFSGPVDLIGNTSICANQTIRFLSSIDGRADLELQGKEIAIEKEVGANERIGHLKLIQVQDCSAFAIKAAAIEQIEGSGTSQFYGDLDTNGPGGIRLTGSHFIQRGTIRTGHKGPIVFSHRESLLCSGSMQTENQPIYFSGPLVLSGPLDLQSGNGDLFFHQTVDGPHPLTISARSITASAPIGSIEPIGPLTLFSYTTVDLQSFQGASAVIHAEKGMIGLHGSFQTDCPEGIALRFHDLLQEGPVTALNGGPFVAAFSGKVINADAHPLVVGSLECTNRSENAFDLQGSVVATTGGIWFKTPIHLVGNVRLDTSRSGGDICFSGPIDGFFDLVLNSGFGEVQISAPLGQRVPLAAFSIEEAARIRTDAIAADSIAISDARGAVLFTGNVNTFGLQGISVRAAEVQFQNSVTTLAQGPLSVELTSFQGLNIAEQTTLVLSGPFSQTGLGSVQLGGSIFTTNQPIHFSSAVHVTHPTVLSTGNEGADIDFSHSIYGADQLILASGRGEIHFFEPTDLPTLLLTQNVQGSVTYKMPVRIGANHLVFSGGSVIFEQSVNAEKEGCQVSIYPGSGHSVIFKGPVGDRHPLASLVIGSAQDVEIHQPMQVGSFAQTNGTGTTSIHSALIAKKGSIAIANQNLFIQGWVTTSASSITLEGRIKLIGSTTIGSSEWGDITFLGPVDGAHDLNLIAKSASIAFGNPIGATIPIGRLTIENALNVTTQSICAAAIVQLAGTSITRFNGPICTTSSEDLFLKGHDFYMQQSIHIGGGLTICHSGTFVFGSKADGTIEGPIHIAPGSVSLGGNWTSLGPIIFAGPVTVLEDTFLDSSLQNGSIEFFSSVNGPGALTCACGKGDLLFYADVGIEPLSAFTILSARSVTTQAVCASSIVQLTQSATTHFKGDLKATGLMTLQAGAITFLGNAQAGDSFTICNEGALTTAAGKTLTAKGHFSQVGQGPVFLGGTIRAEDQNIVITSPLLLHSALTLDSGQKGAIYLNQSVDGPYSLTIQTGTLEAGGNWGSLLRLGPVCLSSASDLYLISITAESIAQNSEQGQCQFHSFDTNGVAGIELKGIDFLQTGSITTSHRGSFLIQNQGLYLSESDHPITLDGAWIQLPNSQGTTQLKGNYVSRDGFCFTGPIMLGSDTTLEATLGLGRIWIADQIGSIVPSTSLLIQGRSVSLNRIEITGSVRVTATDALSFTGNSYRAFEQTYTTPFRFEFQSDATCFSFGGNLHFQEGAICAPPNKGNHLTLLSQTGDVLTGAIGLKNESQWDHLRVGGQVVRFNGDVAAVSIEIESADLLQLKGDLLSTNTPLYFPSPVSIEAPCLISTGTEGGTICFAESIEGAFSLTLAASSGNIELPKVALDSQLVIASANDLFIDQLTANRFIQQSGSGTTTFAGTTCIDRPFGLQITTQNVHILENARVETRNGGSIQINQRGLLSIFGSVIASDCFIQNGIGSTQLSGSIKTGQGGVVFASSVAIDRSATIDTSQNNQSLIFLNGLEGQGNLNLRAGQGDISFQGTAHILGEVNIESAHHITGSQCSAASFKARATGTIKLEKTFATYGAAGIDLECTHLIQNGSFITTGGGSLTLTHSGRLTFSPDQHSSLEGLLTQNGTGHVFLGGKLATGQAGCSFASPITLIADTSLETGSGRGDLHFSGAIDGNHALTIGAGEGRILFKSPIGSIQPLGVLTIASASDAYFPAIQAESVIQLQASGTSYFSGPIQTNGPLGICVTGTGIYCADRWIAAGAGGIEINNTGLFSLSGRIVSATHFDQRGLGPVQLGGEIYCDSGSIGWSGPIELMADTVLSTQKGSLHFLGPVDGHFDLVLDACRGDITATGSIGKTSPLKNLMIVQTSNAYFGAIEAESITQAASTGTTDFCGDIRSYTAEGICLRGHHFSFEGSIATSKSAPFCLIHEGVANLLSSCHLLGPFIQSGKGMTKLSASHFSASSIHFSGDVEIHKDVSLNGPVTFCGTLEGPGGISLTSTCVNFEKPAGFHTRLGAVVFTQTDQIYTRGIKSTYLEQINPVQFTQVLGDLDTSHSKGISLKGVDISLSGTFKTDNQGPFVLSHTGRVHVQANPQTSVSGPFWEEGSGQVFLSGEIQSNGLTLSSPVHLIGSTAIQSNGPICIKNSIDGPFDLLFDTHQDVAISQDLGAKSRLGHFSIRSAHQVTALAVHAETITQQGGTGTTFIGPLNANREIHLAGYAFTLNDSIIGSDLLIDNAAFVKMPLQIRLGGSLIQVGTGSISLSTTVHVLGPQISFSAPLILTGDSALQLKGLPGRIHFAKAVDGPYSLTLHAKGGDLLFSEAVGEQRPLSDLMISQTAHLTSGSIHASSIDIRSAGEEALFQGSLSTTGPIFLQGGAFTFKSSVDAGGLTISNRSVLKMYPHVHFNLKGPFSQTGKGAVSAGGSVHTQGHPIYLASPIRLNGDLTLSTQDGSVHFGSDLEGAHSLYIAAGKGDVVLSRAISSRTSLNNFTIASSKRISMNGAYSLTGDLQLKASQSVTLNHRIYQAASHLYSAGEQIYFTHKGNIALSSSGGAVLLAAPHVLLSQKGDLVVETNGGTFTSTKVIRAGLKTVTVNGTRMIFREPFILEEAPFTVSFGKSHNVIGFPMPEVYSSFFNLASDFYFFVDFIDDQYFGPIANHLFYFSEKRKGN